VKERFVRVAKWIAFPAFYLFCLGLFGYLKFPYDRLRDRVVMELEKRGKPGQRIEIGKLSSYWFTGVELSDVKIHMPPDEPSPSAMSFGAASAPAKESVLTIDEAHARVRILPLLLGRVRLDFWASAFGGEIKGTVPVGAGDEVELTLEGVELAKIEPIAQSVGVPMKGTMSGKLSLVAPEGKFAKANGSLDLKIEGTSVSDGKTKIQGLIELPVAKLGSVVLAAEAKDGILKLTKFEAKGTDLELVGDGKMTLKEPWSNAIADFYIRFKFTDAYRGKSSLTKMLLGEPGGALPGLIESQVPKMKRAKRSDGFYGWHVHGALKRLRYDPSATEATSATSPRRGRGDSPFRRPTPNLPLGASTAVRPSRAPVEPIEKREAAPPDVGRADPPSRAPATPEVAPTPPAPPPTPEPAQPAAPEPAQPAQEQPAQPEAPAQEQPAQ
jgi:type II secretion system protein N